MYIVAFLVVLGLAALTQAQTFTTLYNFTGGSDGGNPFAGVIQGSGGNLYGTTAGGGNLYCWQPSGCGVVFELNNTSGTETVLHSFSGSVSGADGAIPYTPVARDKAGNLYGTTYLGGSAGNHGTVFKMKPGKNGKWKETVLYNFTGKSDGCYPAQGLVTDESGTVFGTTYYCGSSNAGTIFKVDSAGNFTLLHSFAGYPSDGKWPQYGRLTMDKSGNLYGVTVYGGANDQGVLYKLSRSGTFTVLHSFGDTSDGCEPYGSVVQDKSGDLYGTASSCGYQNCGTIWKVSKKGKETLLHVFSTFTSDGCGPYGGVARDSKGNLYGVTAAGGGFYNGGALYGWSPSGTFTLLHSFNYSDGASPLGEVLRTEGTLFGIALYGGTYNEGTVWSYVP